MAALRPIDTSVTVTDILSQLHTSSDMTPKQGVASLLLMQECSRSMLLQQCAKLC
jgi:hypothetical protein